MQRYIALRILEETKQSYNLIAEDFSRTRKNAWEEFKPLAEYVKDGDKVLDLGCGNGRMSELFADPDKYGAGKKVDYTGIDISEKLIAIAKQKYPDKNFQTFDGLKIPFPDNYFDKIFCIAVLHHIPGNELREEFLREARRVLKPGGKLILTVWYLWEKEIYWRLLLKFSLQKLIGYSELDWFDIIEPYFKVGKRYLHLFRKSELAGLVKGAGFKIDKLSVERHGERNRNLFIICRK